MLFSLFTWPFLPSFAVASAVYIAFNVVLFYMLFISTYMGVTAFFMSVGPANISKT